MAPRQPPPARGAALRRGWRTLRTSYWLGWQIESNWTEPFLFVLYAIVRPLGGALILAMMFFVVAGGRRGPMLDFFVVGSAFWVFVVSGMSGMAFGLISDREHWRTLRYIYTSPISLRAYLVGRSLAQVSAASAAAVVTLLFGRFVLGVPLYVTAVSWPYTLLAFWLGLAAIVALGLLVVALAMMVSGDAWHLPEAVGAALYLVCGVIFPVAVLPPVLRLVASLIPLTWWLEAMRRGLLGPDAERSFPWASDAQVLAILTGLTAVTVLVTTTVFGQAERRARALGVLDRESAF
jgi:ABC-2 type transport system permease protein